ncbi:MAG: hypothetical protein KBB55_02225 [Candidatus Buchananbacteria bacterium]|nr:hypothetical protein [Candidatus Buchananbacteria bacterium]
MAFVLIRFFPAVGAVAYLALLLVLPYEYQYWLWITIGAAVAASLYVALCGWRLQRFYFWPHLLYAALLAATGVVTVLVLAHENTVTVVSIGWSVMLGLYLEAFFRHVFKSERAELVDIHYVVSYSSIITWFAVAAVTRHVATFLAYGWWWLPLVSFMAMWVLLVPQLQVSNPAIRTTIGLSAIGALLMAELATAVWYWPVSVWVAAGALTVAGYWLQLAVTAQIWHWTRRQLWAYGGSTAVLIIVLLATAQWL